MVDVPPLIQCRTDEMSKRLRLNLALLLDSIHIHSKSEPLPSAKRVSTEAKRGWEGREGKGGGGTRMLTVSVCRWQVPPYRGTRAPSRGIPSGALPRELR